MQFTDLQSSISSDDETDLTHTLSSDKALSQVIFGGALNRLSRTPRIVMMIARKSDFLDPRLYK